MACSADASFHLVHVCSACKKEGYPIAMFYPGIAMLSDFFISADHVEQLGPKPFGRVNTPYILKVVDVKVLSVCINLSGFFYRSMVLPKNKHGIRICLKSMY